MLEKIKRLIQKLTCKHDMGLNRWHLVHFPEYEPAHVEAEYQCTKCGKLKYLHLYGEEQKQWESILGDYLKVR